MQSSQRPGLLPVPFADTGTKNEIPVNPSATPGLASYKLGFPPVTMAPISAGGVPPAGPDFNGVFNSITQAIRWNQAGGMYPYDASFATAVTGYPVGARVVSSDGSFTWVNSIDNNVADPETTNTGWLPEPSPGAAQVTGLSSSSVTLTALQAARSKIVLSGALTANINLTFPNWVKSWHVVNNCTGNFNVICKTSAGSGVPVGSGKNISISGDGVNITFSSLQALNAFKEIKDLNLVVEAISNLGLQYTVSEPDPTTLIYTLPGGYKLMIFTRSVNNSSTVGAGTTTTITFPQSFPARIYGVFATKKNYVQAAVSCENQSLTGFDAVVTLIATISGGITNTECMFFAVGR